MLKRFVLYLIVVCLSVSPVVILADEGSLQISAKSALLMDFETGEILYSLNPHERLSPASVTKIMPMLLIMEDIKQGKLSYDEIVTGSERAKSMGGSTIFLDKGETLSVRDMLKGIAVASGNDATVAMAEHINGSVEAFVERMNIRAKELGMNDTHFVTCNGLDADGHFSSAYDIAIMSRELMKYEDIFQFTTIWMDSLRDGKFTLSNTNKLIRFYDGATGLKTGSTSLAKNCISATAKRDGMHLIAVVMAAPTSKDRFKDASSLLDYGFANYRINTVVKENDLCDSVRIYKGSVDKFNACYKNGFSYISKRSENKDIEKKTVFYDDIIPPVKKGQIVGRAEFYSDGTLLGASDIISSQDVEKISFKDTFVKLIMHFTGCAK